MGRTSIFLCRHEPSRLVRWTRIVEGSISVLLGTGESNARCLLRYEFVGYGIVDGHCNIYVQEKHILAHMKWVIFPNSLTCLWYQWIFYSIYGGMISTIYYYIICVFILLSIFSIMDNRYNCVYVPYFWHYANVELTRVVIT